MSDSSSSSKDYCFQQKGLIGQHSYFKKKTPENIQKDSGSYQPFDESGMTLLSPAVPYQRQDSGISDGGSLLSPTVLYPRRDSGISEGSPSLASTVSIKSCDSGYGPSSVGSSLCTTPISPCPPSLSLDTKEESVDYSTKADIVSHLNETPSTKAAPQSEVGIHIEYTSSEDFTPTNSPKTSITDTTTAIQTAIHNLPKQFGLDQQQYNHYVNKFFDLFVKDLSLREDTVYPAFNSVSVNALGFGVKTNRVVPCIRVYTDLSSPSDRAWLLHEVAQYIAKAVKDVEGIELSIEECIDYLECDDTKSTIFHPEKLLGAPGEQFKVRGGALNGTLGYFMKGELTISNNDGSLSCTKHFGVTCAHCALPLKSYFILIDEACKHEQVSNQYHHYPIQTLYDCMWEHSDHTTYLPLLLSRGRRGCNGVAYYNGYSYNEELCLIKASICSEGMREIVRKRVTYEDCKKYRHDERNDYKYVLSKFGMIPSGFCMPLPSYLFSDETKQVYHLPFNVDVGILEVNSRMGVTNVHCLNTALASFGTPATVNEMFNEGAITGDRFTRYLDDDFTKKTSPTSCTVVPHSIIDTDMPNNIDTRTVTKLLSKDSFDDDEKQTPLTPRQGSLEEDYDTLTCPPSVSHSPSTPYYTNNIPPVITSTKKNGPIPKAILKGARKIIRTVKATGRNIFSSEEQNEIHLFVMSRQSNRLERPVTRSIKVKNDEFCIEFVHRNPRNRNQYRSFPAVKWNFKKKEEHKKNNFIIEGDSGSSLFLVNKDSNGKEQQVLLGVVCSANTGSRIDFIQEIIAPDLFLYMSNELLRNYNCTDSMRLVCERIQQRVRIIDQLKDVSTQDEGLAMCQRIKEIRLLMKAMESTYTTTTDPSIEETSSWGQVSFKLTECIENCSL